MEKEKLKGKTSKRVDKRQEGTLDKNDKTQTRTVRTSRFKTDSVSKQT